MKSISEFINKNGLREAPLVLCGDFNSTPTSSLAHLINNQEYTISKSLAEYYERHPNRKEAFALVVKDIKDNSHEVQAI